MKPKRKKGKLKMVTAMEAKKDGEEIRIFSLENETDGRVLCRRGTNFLLLKWPNTPNFITIIFTKKNLKFKFQKY